MNPITPVNWNLFKAKFNGREQSTFEWLSYLLFIREFNRPEGIFRYRNQAGIETDPIGHEGNKIGFQAKYFEKRISESENEIIDSLTTAKSKNRDLKKIYFYLNQEFSESSRKNIKEPKYKHRIENSANRLGLEIVWRCPSHLEAQLADARNQAIAEYCFSLEKGILAAIEELANHTEILFNPIRSSIHFNDQEIKIDRNADQNKIVDAFNSSPLLIISGHAGVGKTAAVKDFRARIPQGTPFYAFKASQFNVVNINELMKFFGRITLSEFLDEHEQMARKYFVVDSSEKLADIEDKEPFNQFLSAAISHGWKIIFTTRHSFIDDLRYQCLEVYRTSFQTIEIGGIEREQLSKFAAQYGFPLPSDQKMISLIQNPFYLKEYLQSSGGEKRGVSLLDFKNSLWGRHITKSSFRQNNLHIKREECFLKIAAARATEGGFFVDPTGYDNEALQHLENDEIIVYEKSVGKYFISHDIYEEWALEKFINRSFILSNGNILEFFKTIGSTLPIRRAFRNWMSQKLAEESGDVKNLIDLSISRDLVASYWEDEILVSVLLSDYADIFFAMFQNKLLENESYLLIRITFLLRTACKEVDESWLQRMGLSSFSGIPLQSIFTQPKGRGWIATINFVYQRLNDWKPASLSKLIPLMDDWNKKFQHGEATKLASLTALHFYQITEKRNRYSLREEKTAQVIRVILKGSAEISNELIKMLEEVIALGSEDHNHHYYPIVQAIFQSLGDGSEVIENHAKLVLKLADIIWSAPSNGDRNFGYRLDIEDSFGISRNHEFKYFPASALQTPTLTLLRYAKKETIDFILDFTNKCTEIYKSSDLSHEVEEIVVHLPGDKEVTQAISMRLWCSYRGTQVVPCLLESIHMALERHLLLLAKHAKPPVIQQWCSYLLEKSSSAAITAIVSSVVQSQPEKLFPVAEILFRTKELFLYDTKRHLLDQSHKSGLEMLKKSMPSYQREIYENERISACDDQHRKNNLEHLALHYQFFRAGDVTEEEAKQRQETIWKILDKYYQQLPPPEQESDADKTWRLYLARMDRRKMNVEVKKEGDKILLSMNPEIDPNLKQHSEESIQRSQEPMKYIPLKLWSSARYDSEKENYSKYPQYEEQPHQAYSAMLEIVEGFNSGKQNEEQFYLFNHATPAVCSAVLLRDFPNVLTEEEKELCANILIEHAKAPLAFGEYSFQNGDGTREAIESLPIIIRIFPEMAQDIALLLLLLVMNPWDQSSLSAKRAVLHFLWNTNQESANAIIVGYLVLRPKYDVIARELRAGRISGHVTGDERPNPFQILLERNKETFEKIFSEKLSFDEIGNIETLDADFLVTAFEMLPIETSDPLHIRFLEVFFRIIPEFAFKKNHSDHSTQRRLNNKLAYYFLSSSKENIEKYFPFFVDKIDDSQESVDFIQEFVSIEDRIYKYDSFWYIWDLLFPRIIGIGKKGAGRRNSNDIVRNYLLAWPYWKDDAKEWHSLKDRERLFFAKVSQELAGHPAVLYSLAKLLNGIGYSFLFEGVEWISEMLSKGKVERDKESDSNTIYYLEIICRRLILTERQKLRSSPKLKTQVITILCFLVEQGSATGYLLREDIL